jgi:hypothetical protein
MKARIELINHSDSETLGIFTLHDNNNKLLMATFSYEKGEYEKLKKGEHGLVKYFSPIYQRELWYLDSGEATDYKDKSHLGSFFKGLNNCVLIGSSFHNLHNKGIDIDISDSKHTLKEFTKLASSENNIQLEVC